MAEKVVGKFKKYAHFGFLIPENRSEFGGDFFVSKNNGRDAQDGDTVTGHILAKSKGKKPEAKIVHVGAPKKEKIKNVIGIYSEHKGDFGFVDVPGNPKGFFVFKKDNLGANDGDKVEAKIKIYKGKKEAIVLRILKNESPLIIGKYSDAGKFGFVVPENKKVSKDIFVPGAKKLEAKDGDIVKVQIIKDNGRRPEGIIREIL